MLPLQGGIRVLPSRIHRCSGSDMRLYAVRIFVHDFERACAFYGQVLGLEERYRSDEQGWAEYDVGGAGLGVERLAEDDPEAHLVGRFLGVSLMVEDIEATHARLSAAGVEFTGAPETQPWGGVLAHLADPDGNVLTLLGRTA